MIRVLLVDDHPIVRAGYWRLLEQAGDVALVGEAGDAEAAFASYVRAQPDVTVADLSLPGTSGLALIGRIRAHDPAARILVFSMHQGPSLVRRVLDLGAAGFLSKSAAPEHLIDALRTVHRGQRYVSCDVGAALGEDQARFEAMHLASLTPREFEIFRLLAEGRSAAECAAALELSMKTVSNYQALIKEKLGVSSSAALVHLALRHCIIAPTAA